MECTNALTTDRITGHVEMAPKSHRVVGIEDVCKRLLMDVAQRPVKEAGAYCPICFDDGGDPGRIADSLGELSLSMQGAKVSRQPAEFVWALGDEPGGEILSIGPDDLFDNVLKALNCLGAEGYRCHAWSVPGCGAVKSRRRHIDGQKRNLLQP
jgi:hypothetical protein